MATDAAVADMAPAHKMDHRENASAASTQTSKRDKRRCLLVDRIAQLDEKIGRGGRDQLYREQLQRIQIDTNLVMRVDPYADRPLDGFEEDEQKLWKMPVGGEHHGGPPRSLLEMAGPRFRDWIQEIQDLVEARDFALTKYKFDFEKKVSEYQNTHLFQVETARREHDSLSKTLRDRLINSITAKKNRLNREKEALEISDASALLLHPNQFSITNPVSPGGTHGKRSTRQRREADDANGSDSRKRKRNGGEDDGSPGPQRRALDPATSTPIWQTDRLTKRKTTGPIYSIDKLFTDKELSLTYNTAALSAHKHLLTHKPRVDEHGNFVSSPEASDETGDHEDDVSDVPLAAPTMERNVSHATRSARGGNHHQNFTDNKILGLDVLANFDLPGNFERRIAADPKLPPTFPSNYVRNHGKGAEMNTPTPFTADLVDHDLSLMGMYSQYDTVHGQGSSFDEFGARKILEVAAAPVHENRYVAYLHADRPSENEVRKRLGLPVVAPPETLSERGHHDGGGTPSKTGRSGTPAHSPSKPGGLSGVSALPGGISMSRQSSAGWAPMSRSSSRQKGRAARGV